MTTGIEPTVEIAVLVEVAAQGAGLGTSLLRSLAARARTRGVAVLTCDVLHRNRALRLLETPLPWPAP